MSVWTIDLAHLLRSFDVCDVALFTVTIGANPAFSKETFYKDSIKDDEARVSKEAPRRTRGSWSRRRSVCQRTSSAGRRASWILIVLVDERALVFERDSGEYGGATNTVTRAHESSTPCASKKTKHSKHSNETPPESFSTGAAILDRLFGNARDLRETSADVSRRSFLRRVTKARNIRCDRLWTGTRRHYVVVCGYDESSDCFVVRDPAVPPLDANDASRKVARSSGAGDGEARVRHGRARLLLVRRRRDR